MSHGLNLENKTACQDSNQNCSLLWNQISNLLPFQLVPALAENLQREKGSKSRFRYTDSLSIFLSLPEDMLTDFREKGREGEREREGNINVWLPLVCPLLGTWPATEACALTWESNQWTFGSQTSTQSTEPHQPGQFNEFWQMSIPVDSHPNQDIEHFHYSRKFLHAFLQSAPSLPLVGTGNSDTPESRQCEWRQWRCQGQGGHRVDWHWILPRLPRCGWGARFNLTRKHTFLSKPNLWSKT